MTDVMMKTDTAVILSPFTERAVLSAISAELQLNFLEARNRELKNFNVKGSRTGLVSPVNVTFNEIGAIPPPRMFSDNNTITLSIRNCDPSERNNRTSLMEVDPPEYEASCEERRHFQPSVRDCYHQGDQSMVTVIDDDAPAKEPKLSAVPVRSALKKAKNTMSSSVPVSSANFGSNHSTSGVHIPKTSSSSHVSSSSPRFCYGLPGRSSGDSSSMPSAASNPLTRTRPRVVIRTPVSREDDSDSDSEDSIRWRDYYGDDERGQ